MNVINIIWAVISVIGLLALSILWGILFIIGLRILLPLKSKHTKTETCYYLLACIFTISGFCATVVTINGAILIAKLALFN